MSAGMSVRAEEGSSSRYTLAVGPNWHHHGNNPPAIQLTKMLMSKKPSSSSSCEACKRDRYFVSAWFQPGLAALLMKAAKTGQPGFTHTFINSELLQKPEAGVRMSSRTEQERSKVMMASALWSVHQPAGVRRSSRHCDLVGTSCWQKLVSGAASLHGSGCVVLLLELVLELVLILVLLLNPGGDADPNLSVSPVHLGPAAPAPVSHWKRLRCDRQPLMKAPRWVQEPSAESGILLSETSRRSGRCPPERGAEAELGSAGRAAPSAASTAP